MENGLVEIIIRKYFVNVNRFRSGYPVWYIRVTLYESKDNLLLVMLRTGHF